MQPQAAQFRYGSTLFFGGRGRAEPHNSQRRAVCAKAWRVGGCTLDSIYRQGWCAFHSTVGFKFVIISSIYIFFLSACTPGGIEPGRRRSDGSPRAPDAKKLAKYGRPRMLQVSYNLFYKCFIFDPLVPPGISRRTGAVWQLESCKTLQDVLQDVGD